MSSKIITIIFAFILAISFIAGIIFYWPAIFSSEQKAGENNFLSQIILQNDFLKVSAPIPYQKIANPVRISGESNFFEANVCVRIKDETGKILAESFTGAKGWADALYPFSAEFSYDPPSSPKGFIEVFESSPKDGKEQNKIVVPVLFGDYQVDSQKIKISLYYYNQAKGQEGDPCSEEAVLAVEREIKKTNTPVQDAVNLLLKGELTETEKQEGFNTEFPLEGFSLKGANLKDGLLLLEFEDKENKTSGGSCRAGLLWAQIEKTAKQFSGVEEVSFKPDDVFQP